MKKKGLSIFVSVVLVLCAAWFIWSGKYKRMFEIKNDNMGVISQSDMDDYTNETNNTEDFTAHADANQIFEDTDSMIIEDTISGKGIEMQFTLSNARISRNLEEQYIKNAPSREHSRFSELVMTDDFTFVKDFYYLYITVHVKNITDPNKTSYITNYVPNILYYVAVDNGVITSHSRDKLYNGELYQSNIYSLYETDGKNMISRGYVDKFYAGDELEYNACYVITDETVNKGNVYFTYPFGLAQQKALINKDMRYIKVNIGRDNETDTKE